MQAYFISWQWILSFGLATWFLFIYSPPILRERDAFHRADFFLHLAGAYVLYAACLHNTFYNPFLVRNRHALVGQVGLLCGTVGFLLGVATVVSSWNDLEPRPRFVFGIVGGIFQMELQYSGYRAIQQYKQIKDELRRAGENVNTDARVYDSAGSKNGSAAASSTIAEQEEERQRMSLLREKQRSLLHKHVGCMVSLLVNACGTPAAMRAVDKVGLGPGVAPVVLALGVLHVLKESHVKAISAHLPVAHGKKE